MLNPNDTNPQATPQAENLDGSAIASPAPEASAPENWIPGPSNPFGEPRAQLDFSKPVRTKGGKAVQIVAIVHAWNKPVIGIIECAYLGKEPLQWGLVGDFMRNGEQSNLDLENYDPTAPTTGGL